MEKHPMLWKLLAPAIGIINGMLIAELIIKPLLRMIAGADVI